MPDELAGRLPVLIRLRDFWGGMGCRAEHGDWTARQLEQSILRWLDDHRPHGLLPQVFERNLAEGNLLLLLDGVDEVPEEHFSDGQLIHPRQALLTGLANALPGWRKDGNRIVVTSRPYGLRPNERDRLGLPEVGLLPLDREVQHLFIKR